MPGVRDLVIERRRRTIATIMGHAERTFFARLTGAEKDAFRAKVFEAIDGYHDLVLDVVKVSDGDAIRNMEALELISRVHDSQQRLERAFSQHDEPAHV